MLLLWYMRIPMQVYFDQEIIEFYKEYARQEGKSFAAIIRKLLEEYKEKIPKEEKSAKRGKGLNERQKLTHSFIKTIQEGRKKFSKTRYYFPELTDNELMYGKSS